MKHYESLIIGHVTIDRNIDHLDNEVIIPGGAVIYSSASAHALSHKVAALTKVAEADRERLGAFTIGKEDIICLDSAESTDMYNKYFTPDKERRTTKCFSRGDEIKFEDIPDDIDADIYHFAGLIYGDFSSDTVIKTAKKGDVAGQTKKPYCRILPTSRPTPQKPKS